MQMGSLRFLPRIVLPTAFSLATLSLTTAVAIPSAQADEVWGSDYGSVVYQEDRGDIAVLTYGDRLEGTLFINGLGGEWENRGTYSGYWSQSSSQRRCETAREGRFGEPTHYWGRVEMEFLDSAFPARWSARIGYCDQEPTLSWMAYPIVGEDVPESPESLELP